VKLHGVQEKYGIKGAGQPNEIEVAKFGS